MRNITGGLIEDNVPFILYVCHKNLWVKYKKKFELVLNYLSTEPWRQAGLLRYISAILTLDTRRR
jgi:hypothetical protein